MQRSGFVLAGGQSARMGRDKALLPVGSRTLLEATASKIAAVAPYVAIIANPDRYSNLPWPVYPDLIPGRGPLSGLHAALCLQVADWNLVVACDMPQIPVASIANLFQTAESIEKPDLAAVVPESAGGLEPLCAVYHSSCLRVVETALRENRLSMRDLLKELNIFEPELWPAPALMNLNTPEDWAQWKRDSGR